ncbi:MAG: hypothetical protein ABGZ53_36895 [Fuerstiella sp.]
MAKKRQELEPSKNGVYERNLGKCLTRLKRTDPTTGATWEESKIVRPKFRLGKDKAKANIANLRLEQLWDLVVQCWKDGESQFDCLPDEPLWDDATRVMAKAVAKGKMQVVLDRRSDFNGDDDLNARWIRTLIERYSSVINIVPAFEDEYREVTKREVQKLNQVKESLEQATGVSISPTTSETLHNALDDYIQHIRATCLTAPTEGEDQEVTGWGFQQINNAGRLKEHHPDCPISRSTLTLDVVEGMFRHWANRPHKKGTKKPIAVKTADTHMKQLRNFLKWLHKNPNYSWRKPEDFDDIKIEAKSNTKEIAAKLTTAQVETFSLEELCLLYEYATPLERALLLLGLNCGFGTAESGSLLLNQICLFEAHPEAALLNYKTAPDDSFIKRIRIKNEVYGEFKLWPQTVEAMQWVFNRRKGQKVITRQPDKGKNITAQHDSVAILADSGHSFIKPTQNGNHSSRIPNLWREGLCKRIQKDYSEFRLLSIGKLRKTAGDLVKRFSSGEISGVFLCHGNPVKSDTLQDIYTNRPFGKVFEANMEVAEFLAPMFAKCDAPFPFKQKKGGANITRQQVAKIQQLRSQGVSPTVIAEQVGVSPQTVHRRSEPAHADK